MKFDQKYLCDCRVIAVTKPCRDPQVTAVWIKICGRVGKFGISAATDEELIERLSHSKVIVNSKLGEIFRASGPADLHIGFSGSNFGERSVGELDISFGIKDIASEDVTAILVRYKEEEVEVKPGDATLPLPPIL